MYMNKYLSAIGYQGPNILLVLILIGFFYTNITNLYLYGAVFIWQFASHLFNIIIKNTLKAPRPDSELEEFARLKKSINFKNYLIIHRNFGMPSGHAQAMLSELTFIMLYFKQPIIIAIALLQTALTLWQRYSTKRHSLHQLLAGSIIGIGVGLVFYRIVIDII